MFGYDTSKSFRSYLAAKGQEMVKQCSASSSFIVFHTHTRMNNRAWYKNSNFLYKIFFWQQQYFYTMIKWHWILCCTRVIQLIPMWKLGPITVGSIKKIHSPPPFLPHWHLPVRVWTFSHADFILGPSSPPQLTKAELLPPPFISYTVERYLLSLVPLLWGREYWMIYRGQGFLAVVWLGGLLLHSFPLPLPSVSSTGEGDTYEDWERERQLADGRGEGSGWGRSQIIRRRESLFLYKLCNTLCH